MTADHGAGHGDPAAETLFLPLLENRLTWPDRGVLWLRARVCASLRARSWPQLLCEQSFKPEADALIRAGYALRDPDDTDQTRRYPLVLVLPPRQRDEARALMARAIASCEPGGIVLASMRNEEGAKSGEADLKALAGLSGSLSKHHCRVFWACADPRQIDTELLTRWSGLDMPRPIAEGRFISRPGVFAWDRIDAASALLAAHLPEDLRGRVADLGAGYGYLSAELLRRCPGITALDVYEAEARALAMARCNLDKAATGRALGFFWHDVAGGLPRSYDAIVSNPPFHAQGRGARPDIGRAFIVVAAEALAPGGRLWLVANRHLPYESTLDTRFGTVRTVAEAQGFKVIEAIKANVAGERGRA